MKFALFAALIVVLCLSYVADAQTWTPMTNQPGFSVGTPLLLTDGSVFVQEAYTDLWWRLVPDVKGNYEKGTWVQAASAPGWGPTYFASDVLKDGRVFVMGGEYNDRYFAESNTGAIYDPVADTWTPISAPSGWLEVGDAASCEFPDGRVMMSNILYTPGSTGESEAAILDPTTLTWTSAGNSGKLDANTEEGWTLLPDGSILTVDVHDPNNAERYLPSVDSWVSAGATISTLPNTAVQEIGPSVLLPTGSVFAVGATSNTGIYAPPTKLTGLGTWSDGPVIPSGLDSADGPACVLPDGNVLFVASAGTYQSPSQFYEFDGTNINAVPNPANASISSSYYYALLMLPNGQVMATNQSGDVEFYTPAGLPQAAWKPKIISAPNAAVATGANYPLVGKQINGLTQCSAYGDDVQNATNYPIVCITNLATGNKAYCRTHDHSTMAVATGKAKESTYFDVPYLIDAGPSRLQVIANGIASLPVPITVTSYNLRSVSPASINFGAVGAVLTAIGNGFDANCVITLDGNPQPTTFVSSSKLRFILPTVDAQSAGLHTIGVVNASSIATNAVQFDVTNPRPAITSLTPRQIPADGKAHLITIIGKNFSQSSIIGFTWVAVGTDFISPTELQFVIPAVDTTTDGVGYVWVYNPGPGGGNSARLTFTLGN